MEKGNENLFRLWRIVCIKIKTEFTHLKLYCFLPNFPFFGILTLPMNEFTEGLNPEQFKAVTTINGPVLIIAGAGSGKTRVITFRIAHMLDKGIPQSQILALTFTNKAAKEMADRIKELTGKKLQNLTVSTFHAFGVKVLRSHIDKIGWRSNFSIYDETMRKRT